MVLRSYLVLCHHLTFGYRGRRRSPGRRGRLAAATRRPVLGVWWRVRGSFSNPKFIV